MMAFERPPTDNYLDTSERPETSKFSRQSKRSDFHMTFTDFGVTTTSITKGNAPTNRKNDSQTKFYTSKTKFPKTQSFSSLKTSNNNNKDTETKGMTQSQVEYNWDDENNANKMNHTNALPTSEFVQGMTLDKFLGTGFKKIDINGTTLKEFERNKQVDDKDIDKLVNDLSEPDDKEYQYESFEILETDDEEDTMSEINQNDREKDGLKTHIPRESNITSENHEVLSKIQNKYKSSKPKYLPKTKPKSFRVRSPLKEKEDFEIEKNISEPIKQEQIIEPKSHRTESKSLSPKFRSLSSQKKSFYNGRESAQFPKENTTYTAEDLVETSQSFKPDNSSPTSLIRGFSKKTSNAFQTSNDNLRSTSDKFRTTFMRKTSYNKSSVQPTIGTEYYDDSKYEEKERSATRSNSIVTSYKPVETVNKYQIERGSGNSLEQKFNIENKMMAKKIKQSEKDMMDKYARMFKLNQHEVINLCKENDRKPEGVKRLSTPLKEFNTLRGLSKR